jgi:D-glycerate 3-kinase
MIVKFVARNFVQSSGHVHALGPALHAFVADSRRVDEYYAPLGLWCASRVSMRAKRPCVLGLQGPQGCGKSTLAAALVQALVAVGVRAISVSIDDFYLTHQEQLALAARYPGNPYLVYRGYPGTHDIDLGVRQIEAIAALRPNERTFVPVYDKSARDGRGDRAPALAWRPVTGPIDLLILEGWMLGFSPVEEAKLEPNLRAPNVLLAEYAAWNRKLDAFVSLYVEPLDTIVTWRIDSERARRSRGEAALSDEDARDYIERFLPAYRVYVPALAARPPCNDVRRIELGSDRMPLRPLPGLSTV